MIGVKAAVTTPTILDPPIQSENAEEGERKVSLPTETSREEFHDSQENLKTEMPTPTLRNTQEMNHCTDEESKDSRILHQERECESQVEEESTASSLLMNASRQTDESQDIQSKISQQTDIFPNCNQGDSMAGSCCSTVHSPFPGSQPPSKPYRHIPPSQNIPSSSSHTAASSTTQPQIPVTDVIQDAGGATQTAPRELFVVLAAVIMRLMLAVDWFLSFGVQVRLYYS